MFLQVAQLRAENSTIMKRVNEITLKFQEAAMENRVLKADVASLQAKVMMLYHSYAEIKSCPPMITVF